MSARKELTLGEFESIEIDRSDLTDLVADRIQREYARRLTLEPPTLRTGGRWRLTANSWIGCAPVHPMLSVRVTPKVPVASVLRMLDYAHDLTQFVSLEGAARARDLEGISSFLASRLASMVLARAGKGFLKGYSKVVGDVAGVQGEIDMAALSRRPWATRLPCTYRLQTQDIAENRVIAWTLFLLSRMDFASPNTSALVRRAFRAIESHCTLSALDPRSALFQHRLGLTNDYKALLALCRFFLFHTNPSAIAGESHSVPFMVEMNSLFETFVARWLTRNAPERLRITTQATHLLDPRTALSFRIDILVQDRATGRVLAVVDTKYKNRQEPTPADVAQVVAYAAAKRCNLAILVLPVRTRTEVEVGGFRVRAIPFDLASDLETSGRQFLDAVLRYIDGRGEAIDAEGKPLGCEPP